MADDIKIIPSDDDRLEGEMSEEQKERLKAAFDGLLNEYRDVIAKAIEPLINIITSQTSQTTSDLLQTLKEFLQEQLNLVYEIKELEPYLEKELEKESYDFTVDDLMELTAGELRDMLDEPGSLLLQALEAARAAKEKDNATGSKKLRTASRAGDIQDVSINRLAIPTADDFLYAISLQETGKAFLRQIDTAQLTFDSGKLYFADGATREVSEMELKNLQTKENIESINLPFLQFYYTLFFKTWEKSIREQAEGGSGKIQPITKFYLPDLAKARGLSQNASQESMEAIKKDAMSFHNVVGVLKEEGYKKPSYYPVLNFEGYDTTTNTIMMSSPYLMHVVDRVFRSSVRRNKDGTAKLKSDGTPKQIAVNSYLVHADIQKERNKAAVQNVFLLVQGIERSGKNGYHISATTLINRNPILKSRLEQIKDKNGLLKRAFKKTWELLISKTDLREVYTDIKLPDPDNPANIPTYSRLADFVIKIPHKGKAKTEN